MNYPAPDPAWDYFHVWESLLNAASIIEVSRAFLSTVENTSAKTDRIIQANVVDAIAHLNQVNVCLRGESDRRQPITPFLKIGDRLINLTRITAVDFHSIDDDENRCAEVGFGDSSAYFYGEEAEILKRFFLSGSKAYDLNNLFG